MNSLRKLFGSVLRQAAIQIVGLAVLAASGAEVAPNAAPLPRATVDKQPEGLTPGEWNLIRAAVDQDQHRLHAQGEAYRATNPAQGLYITFSPEGFEVTPGRAGRLWALLREAGVAPH